MNYAETWWKKFFENIIETLINRVVQIHKNICKFLTITHSPIRSFHLPSCLHPLTLSSSLSMSFSHYTHSLTLSLSLSLSISFTYAFPRKSLKGNKNSLHLLTLTLPNEPKPTTDIRLKNSKIRAWFRMLPVAALWKTI